jgi:hypothetical protein
LKVSFVVDGIKGMRAMYDWIGAVDGCDECLVSAVIARDIAGEESICSWYAGCGEGGGYDGVAA